MGRTVLRTILVVALVVSFLLIWASIAFNWPLAQWIVLIGYVVFAIGLVIALIRRRRVPRATAAELSASDEYSDIQLGRRPITHYPRDEAGTSQVGDPPEGR